MYVESLISPEYNYQKAKSPELIRAASLSDACRNNIRNIFGRRKISSGRMKHGFELEAVRFTSDFSIILSYLELVTIGLANARQTSPIASNMTQQVVPLFFN